MERIGIMVDGAHASYRTVMDAIAVSTKPFIVQAPTSPHSLTDTRT